MPKAYWLAHVDVLDTEPYSVYAKLASVSFAKYGANILARGGNYQPLEGKVRARNVVIEFESMDQAMACYNSPEYQEAKLHRKDKAEAELLIVEGV